MMACQYNAKFLFDHPGVPQSNEEITFPLRDVLKKNVRFKWSAAQEESYKLQIAIMKSPATLRPFHLNKQTHFVADASEVGTKLASIKYNLITHGYQWIIAVEH